MFFQCVLRFLNEQNANMLVFLWFFKVLGGAAAAAKNKKQNLKYSEL